MTYLPMRSTFHGKVSEATCQASCMNVVGGAARRPGRPLSGCADRSQLAVTLFREPPAVIPNPLRGGTAAAGIA
jgi:hypothetical protein